jgi:uncharacterized protein YggE
MEREIVVRGTGEARALPDQASLKVEVTADHKTQDGTRLAAAPFAAETETENLTPTEMTVQVDVDVGFTVLDLAGHYHVDLG